MMKFSEGFALSIIKGVKKECFMSNIAIPSDQLVLSLLKLFILNPIIQYSDSGRTTKELIECIIVFLKTTASPSIFTLKMQGYFHQNYQDNTIILQVQQKKISKNIRALRHLILQKSIKSREDYDQLYHHICCLVVLMNGIGDPTDKEILKETIGSLKSILTTKDLARFASKPRSLKEKQLQDINLIVTGILVYNKNFAHKEDDSNDLTTVLERALQKCYNFLETKLLELDEKTSSVIHSFLKFQTDGEVKNSSIINYAQKIDESNDGKYIKSYIISMQQYKLYFRILMQSTGSLIEEFKVCFEQLQKRTLRVRKTVKFRNAIPVTEIYPQFKDISLSWDKMQELSILLNNIADIISYLRNTFDKISTPQFNFVSDMETSEVIAEYDPKVSKNTISTLNSSCELIQPDDDSSFHLINVERFVASVLKNYLINLSEAFKRYLKVFTEYHTLPLVQSLAQFCIIMFVDTKGVLAQGIKEYGLIKYQNMYFCFSSGLAITKFCLSPEMYIETLLELVFVWPETISLLRVEEWLEKRKNRTRSKRGAERIRCLKETGIQTDVHPTLVLSTDKCISYKFVSRKIDRWTQQKDCRTHSVQTIISNFRRDMCTQTTMMV